MEKFYEIAGIPICVSANPEIMYEDDRELAPFRTGEISNAVRYRFDVVNSLPAGDRKRELYRAPDLAVFGGVGGEEYRYVGTVSERPENGYMMAHYMGDAVDVVLNRGEASCVAVRCVLNALAMEHLAVSNGGVILHCAYIIYNGQAVLFTAPSGGGKSTQAELWRKYLGAEIINGDRAIIVPGGGMTAAYSLPYAGSSGICKNKTAPVKAIIYLRQAKKDSAVRLRGGYAFSRVWEGCFVNTWNRDDVARAADAVSAVVGSTPVFMLECTPERSAADTMLELLEQK
jgi:hypothetical protein